MEQLAASVEYTPPTYTTSQSAPAINITCTLSENLVGVKCTALYRTIIREPDLLEGKSFEVAVGTNTFSISTDVQLYKRNTMLHSLRFQWLDQIVTTRIYWTVGTDISTSNLVTSPFASSFMYNCVGDVTVTNGASFNFYVDILINQWFPKTLWFLPNPVGWKLKPINDRSKTGLEPWSGASAKSATLELHRYVEVYFDFSTSPMCFDLLQYFMSQTVQHRDVSYRIETATASSTIDLLALIPNASERPDFEFFYHYSPLDLYGLPMLNNQPKPYTGEQLLSENVPMSTSSTPLLSSVPLMLNDNYLTHYSYRIPSAVPSMTVPLNEVAYVVENSKFEPQFRDWIEQDFDAQQMLLQNASFQAKVKNRFRALLRFYTFRLQLTFKTSTMQFVLDADFAQQQQWLSKILDWTEIIFLLEFESISNPNNKIYYETLWSSTSFQLFRHRQVLEYNNPFISALPPNLSLDQPNYLHEMYYMPDADQFLRLRCMVLPKYSEITGSFWLDNILLHEAFHDPVEATSTSFFFSRFGDLLLSRLEYNFFERASGKLYLSWTVPLFYLVTDTYLANLAMYPQSLGMVQQPQMNTFQLAWDRFQAHYSRVFWFCNSLNVQFQYRDSNQSLQVLTEMPLDSSVPDVVSDPAFVFQFQAGKQFVASFQDEYVLGAYLPFVSSTHYDPSATASLNWALPQWVQQKYSNVLQVQPYYQETLNNTLVAKLPLQNVTGPTLAMAISIPIQWNSKFYLSVVQVQSGSILHDILITHAVKVEDLQAEFAIAIEKNVVKQIKRIDVHVPNLYREIVQGMLWNSNVTISSLLRVSTGTNVDLKTTSVVSLPSNNETMQFDVDVSVPASLTAQLPMAGSSDLSNLEACFQMPIEYDQVTMRQTPHLVLTFLQAFQMGTYDTYDLQLFAKYMYTDEKYEYVHTLQTSYVAGETLPAIPFEKEERFLQAVYFQFVPKNETRSQPLMTETWNLLELPMTFSDLVNLQEGFVGLCDLYSWSSIDGLTLNWDEENAALLFESQTGLHIVSKDFQQAQEGSPAIITWSVTKPYWQQPEVLTCSFTPVSTDDFFQAREPWIHVDPLYYSSESSVTLTLDGDWNTEMYREIMTLSAIYTLPTDPTVQHEQNLGRAQWTQSIATRLSNYVLSRARLHIGTATKEIVIPFLPDETECRQAFANLSFLLLIHQQLYVHLPTLEMEFLQKYYWNAAAQWYVQVDGTWLEATTEPRTFVPVSDTDVQVKVVLLDESVVLFSNSNVTTFSLFDTLPLESIVPQEPFTFALFGTQSSSTVDKPEWVHVLVRASYVQVQEDGVMVLPIQRQWGEVVELVQGQVYNNTDQPLVQVSGRLNNNYLLERLEFGLSSSTQWQDVAIEHLHPISILRPVNVPQLKTQLRQQIRWSSRRTLLLSISDIVQLFDQYFRNSGQVSILFYRIWYERNGERILWMQQEWSAMASSILASVSSDELELSIPPDVLQFELELFMYDQSIVLDFSLPILSEHLLVYRLGHDEELSWTSPLECTITPIYQTFDKRYRSTSGAERVLGPSRPSSLPIATLFQNSCLVGLKLETPFESVTLPVYCKPDVGVLQTSIRLNIRHKLRRMILDVATLTQDYLLYCWNVPPNTTFKAWFEYDERSIPLDLDQVSMDRTRCEKGMLRLEVSYPHDQSCDVIRIRHAFGHPSQLLSRFRLFQDGDQVHCVLDDEKNVYQWPLVPVYNKQPYRHWKQTLDETTGFCTFPFRDAFGNTLHHVCIGDYVVGWRRHVDVERLRTQVFVLGQDIVLESGDVLQLFAPGKLHSTLPCQVLATQADYTVVQVEVDRTRCVFPIFHQK